MSNWKPRVGGWPLAGLLLLLVFGMSERSPGQWYQAQGSVYVPVENLEFSGPFLLIGTSYSGLLRSTNSGANWTPVSGLLRTRVPAVAAGATDLFAVSDSGVFRSTDTGLTWNSAGLVVEGWRYLSDIAVSGTKVFVSEGWGDPYWSGGVWRTTDDGLSWSQVASGLPSTNCVKIEVIGGDLFVALSGGGVFRSTNDGVSWANAGGGLPATEVSSFARIGTNLFAATLGAGVYVTTNSGGHWTACSAGLTNSSVSCLAARGTELFAGTYGGGMFSSVDNGATWTHSSDGLSDPIVTALGVGGSRLVAGTWGGSMYLLTDNPRYWRLQNAGGPQPGSRVYSMGVRGRGVFATGFRSSDGGFSWTAISGGLTDPDVRSYLVCERGIFAGTASGYVFRSIDEGTNWIRGDPGLPYPVFALANIGATLFAGLWGGGVYRSTNDGTSWTAVNSGLTLGRVSSLAVRDGRVFAGTQGRGVFRSTNNGESWLAVNSGLGNGQVVNALMFRGAELFAGTYMGVYRSTDFGGLWTSVNDGMTGGIVASLASTPQNVFAGTLENGIFVTSNSGASWAATNSGLPSAVISSLAVCDTNVLAGTWYHGVWLRPLSDFALPAVNMEVLGGWNLVSLPVDSDDTRVGTVFPTAASDAFRYLWGIGYSAETLLAPGVGYWLKFDSPQSLTVAGNAIHDDTISVDAGWNLIGTIGFPIPADSVLQSPPNIVASDFFHFDGTLSPSDTLWPGSAYWVRLSGAGRLIFSVPSSAHGEHIWRKGE